MREFANIRSIWTHNMKEFKFHKSFKACESSEPQMAGTVGAGVQDGELFENMAKHNAIAVGGTNSVINPLHYNLELSPNLMQTRMSESSDGPLPVATDTPRVSTAWEPIPLSRRNSSHLRERS